LQTKELKSEILWENTLQRTVKKNSGKELEKEMPNVTEESCVGGDISNRNFTVGRLRGKRGISHYVAEVVYDFYGYEYEIRLFLLLHGAF
jgi:hypothetical protein